MEAVLDTGAGHGLADAVGKHRRLRPPVDLLEPGLQLRDGALPERDDTLLAPLSVQVNCVGAVEEDVGDAQADHLGDARPGVVQHGKQRGIALSAPSSPIRRIEQSLNFLAREEPKDGPIEPFAGDGEDTLCNGQGCRIAHRDVAHEGTDCGEP